MKNEIIKGNYAHLKNCEEILLESSIGDHYFQKEGSARKAIEEGLDQGTLFVAIAEGVCTGFMFYIKNGAFHSFPYLHIIVVKEEYRSKGIGKDLIDYYENISDGDKFFLVVGDFNSNAKRLYEKIGYCQVGEISGLYREGITEYIMMKEKSK
ncbi:GNAT family N-acetyltransferase [Clostridium sp. E02]|uniref:GNAT family N-acetyltransferase n=1 Tax=Clostridium sp. E02 TaxID=2487134 RepID=UPI000F547641|nr:GNAT family N-acetyltransferase [Clostridium sp. E02]